MSSFVETTLPPGYRLLHRGDHSWQLFVGGFYRAEYNAPEPGRRHAWRHWTATVLRGRDVVASVHCLQVTVGSASVFYNHFSKVFYVNAEPDLDGTGCRDHTSVAMATDPDEAMARFAWLVGATEGMVPR